jgi:hypothetical protein
VAKSVVVAVVVDPAMDASRPPVVRRITDRLTGGGHAVAAFPVAMFIGVVVLSWIRGVGVHINPVVNDVREAFLHSHHPRARDSIWCDYIVEAAWWLLEPYDATTGFAPQLLQLCHPRHISCSVQVGAAVAGLVQSTASASDARRTVSVVS